MRAPKAGTAILTEHRSKAADRTTP